MATISFDGQGISQFSSIAVETLYPDLTITNQLISGTMVLDPAADSAVTQYGELFWVQTADTNTKNLTSVMGLSSTLEHQGSGTITTAIGLNQLMGLVSTAGTITSAIALKTSVYVVGAGGTITNGYGWLAATPTNLAGTFTHYYGLYAEEIGAGTNKHYLWFNSDGVLDIREASSQAIIGLHNPGITKYTSGSANYERSVLQWASHILQIGAETGGTGTLRKVQVLGAGLLLGTDILPSSDPGVPGQVYRIAGALMVSL